MSTQPDKPKAKWGDLLALAIGAGLTAYFVRGGREKLGDHQFNSGDLWDLVFIILPVVLVLGVATYFLGRLLGVIGDWIRSRWAGKQ